jgi:hypothetical protein
MTNRHAARGTLKEKDSKLEDSSIFKFLSPAHEIPSADHLMQDKQLTQSSQKALHLPPLRMKTIRNTKTAATLRGITSESLKQILKESINFSERLSDVQLMHHQAGGPSDPIREVTHSFMHESPQLQNPSLMWPAIPQARVIAPIDVKNFQLSITHTATTGRVGKPSRLIVSNQTGSQNGLQPAAPKSMTPSGSSSYGAMRASLRKRKVAVKYFGYDKTEQQDFYPENGRAEGTVDGARSLLTCLEFKPSCTEQALEYVIRKGAHEDVLGSGQSHFSAFQLQRPTTSNDTNIVPSQVLTCVNNCFSSFSDTHPTFFPFKLFEDFNFII